MSNYLKHPKKEWKENKDPNGWNIFEKNEIKIKIQLYETSMKRMKYNKVPNIKHLWKNEIKVNVQLVETN